MKNFLFGAVLLITVSILPVMVRAQTGLTSIQINAIIQLLQSFGADQSVINNVQVSLNGGAPTAMNQSNGVSLRTIPLSCLSTDPNNPTSVKQFQAQYGITQTGTIGPVTRAKINAVCSSQSTQTNASPVPTTNKDGAIQSDLATIQTQAEIFYGNNKNSYGTAGTGCRTSGSMFGDSIIANAIAAIGPLNGNAAMTCVNTAQAYAVEAPLSSDSTQYWCVDSTGNAVKTQTLLTGTVCPGGRTVTAQPYQPVPQSVPPTTTTSGANQIATVPDQYGCTATTASSPLSGTIQSIQSISNDLTQIVFVATRTYTIQVSSATAFVSASGAPLTIANFGRDDQVTMEGSIGNGGMGAYCSFSAQKITLNVSGIHTLTMSGKVASVLGHPQTVMILEDNGLNYSFSIAPSTVVYSATGAVMTIDGLHGGDSITITGQGRTGDRVFAPSQIQVIASLTQIQIPVAPVGTQTVNASGTILAISGGNITLSAIDGKIYTVQVTPPTNLYPTTYSGAATTLADLHTGDSVAVAGHASAAYLAGGIFIADTIKKN